MILNLETITKQREDKMNELWKIFQNILTNYSEQTEEKYNEYVQLREQDNADTKEIKDHYIEIAKITEQIKNIKDNLHTDKIQHNIHVNQLKKYKNCLREKYQQLKTEMESNQKYDKEKLKCLVVCCTKADEVRVKPLLMHRYFFFKFVYF